MLRQKMKKKLEKNFHHLVEMRRMILKNQMNYRQRMRDQSGV